LAFSLQLKKITQNLCPICRKVLGTVRSVGLFYRQSGLTCYGLGEFAQPSVGASAFEFVELAAFTALANFESKLFANGMWSAKKKIPRSLQICLLRYKVQ
jgi:hypothetical protein